MADEPRATRDELAEAADRERKHSAVRSLDMSFNELADMYSTGELHITPAYQRTFRWSEAKQSRFIESIILEMPLPPIYAVEVTEGKWELIDGLQRLSTFLHLRGQLHLPDRNPPIEKGKHRLRLEGCDIIQELNGFEFDELPSSLQYRVRRATLRVEVVRREKDEKEQNTRFAYHMFKRLNMGGEPLSDQEARNCSIRLLGERFIEFILELSNDAAFQACIEDITDEYRARMGESELVLRFFAFKNNLQEYVHEIEPFMTDFMERVTDGASERHIPFDYAEEARVFRRTFDLLQATLGRETCRRYVFRGTKGYSGGFSISHFEAFSVGMSRVIDDIPEDADPAQMLRIKEALETAKQSSELRNLTTGGGKNFRRIFEEKISLVEHHVRAVL